MTTPEQLYRRMESGPRTVEGDQQWAARMAMEEYDAWLWRRGDSWMFTPPVIRRQEREARVNNGHEDPGFTAFVLHRRMVRRSLNRLYAREPFPHTYVDDSDDYRGE